MPTVGASPRGRQIPALGLEVAINVVRPSSDAFHTVGLTEGELICQVVDIVDAVEQVDILNCCDGGESNDDDDEERKASGNGGLVREMAGDCCGVEVVEVG